MVRINIWVGGDDMADQLAELIDTMAVQDVLVRYFTALDTLNWPLLKTCFVPDVAATYGARPAVQSYDAIEQMCREALEPLQAVQHLASNFEVQLHGDTATTRCNLSSTHVRKPPGVGAYVVGAVYNDELVRTADGWRIATRIQTRVWTEEKPTAVGVTSVRT